MDCLMRRRLHWLFAGIVLLASFSAAYSLCSARIGGSPSRVIELAVDAKANVRRISPYIYGLNFASRRTLEELGIKLNRYGGNRSTRYNWQLDVTNTGADYFFQNISLQKDDGLKDYQRFIDDNQRADTDSIVTIPMIGWVARDGSSSGFSIIKYGLQGKASPERPDAGNGVDRDGRMIRGNEPRDTSLEVGVEFQKAWVRDIVSTFGTAAEGGVKFYALDNEPCLWHRIHRDVHPQPATYDELLDLSVRYARAIKEVDPSCQVMGPVVYGWGAYFYSPADGFKRGQDRAGHSDAPFLEWYLRRMREAEARVGFRLLDVLDIHYYPEARTDKRVVFDGAGDDALKELRVRSVRSLWDAGYEDESYIKQAVRLIPRMKEIIARNYPGTKLSISEYSWGAYEDISCALAQAEALGVFGREGLDMASYWIATDRRFYGTPTYFAFRIFRNFDGKGGRFGDTSIGATSSDDERVSIYSSLSQDSKEMYLVVINKTRDASTARVKLRNFGAGGEVERYCYSGDDLKEIKRMPSLQLESQQGFNLSLPGHSITLLRLQSNTILRSTFDVRQNVWRSMFGVRRLIFNVECRT